jgi:FMN hydrolase / 5-amino-6-(5-phospho-D-ribitylamino)uracil phosphatase
VGKVISTLSLKHNLEMTNSINDQQKRLASLPAIDFSRVKALSLDLDETLWPIMPTIIRAEQLTDDWIAANAPSVTAKFDNKALRALREQLQADDPSRKIDLLKARRDTLLHAFAASGESSDKALAALDVFVQARQVVTLFDDVLTFLDTASARLPIAALSNGFADVHIVGIGKYFKTSVSAHIVGIAKPDRRIFDLTAQALGLANDEILHIGDDFELDVQGALDAGMQAYYVCRPEQGLVKLTEQIHEL